MTFKDGENVYSLRLDAVDDPVIPFEDFSDGFFDAVLTGDF